MPPKRFSRKSNRGRRNVLLPPITSYQKLYSGKIAGNTTVAFSIITKAATSSYRVSQIRMEACGTDLTKPVRIQLAIRGEGGETESNYSFPFTIGASSKVLTLRQSRGQGYWTPISGESHVGWLRNIGNAEVTYTCVVFVSERQEFSTSQSENTVTVFPN